MSSAPSYRSRSLLLSSSTLSSFSLNPISPCNQTKESTVKRRHLHVVHRGDMYPSTLMTPSSSSHHRSFLGSPFLNSTPRCITKNSTSTTRRRFRVSVPCNSLTSAADQPSTSSEELSNSTTSATDRVFGSKKELKGIEVLVDKLSPPVRLASSAIIIAGAVAAGYGLGTRFGGSRNAALGGAVALGAVGGATTYALTACAPQVAAVNLITMLLGLTILLLLRRRALKALQKS